MYILKNETNQKNNESNNYEYYDNTRIVNRTLKDIIVRGSVRNNQLLRTKRVFDSIRTAAVAHIVLGRTKII